MTWFIQRVLQRNTLLKKKLETLRLRIYQQTNTLYQAPLRKGYVVYRYEEFPIGHARYAGVVGVVCMLGGAAFTLFLKKKYNDASPEVMEKQNKYTKFYGSPFGYSASVGFLLLTVLVVYITVVVPGKIVRKIILSVDRQTVVFQLYNTFNRNSTKTVSYPVRDVYAHNNRVTVGKKNYYIANEAEIPNPSLFNLAIGMNRKASEDSIGHE